MDNCISAREASTKPGLWLNLEGNEKAKVCMKNGKPFHEHIWVERRWWNQGDFWWNHVVSGNYKGHRARAQVGWVLQGVNFHCRNPDRIHS